MVQAARGADLLILARHGGEAGPRNLGKAARFVVDHAACPVLLVWPGAAPLDPLPPPPPPEERPKPLTGPRTGAGTGAGTAATRPLSGWSRPTPG